MSRPDTPLTAPPVLRCPLCQDSGWVIAPGEDGVSRARRCDCSKRTGVDRELGAARIPKRYEHCKLSSFFTINDSLGEARQVAEAFVRDYPQNDAGLLFSGPCGSGKTHLGVAILQELIHRHRAAALYVDCALLIRNLQDSFSSDELSRPEILRPIEEAEVVLLDDLGGSKASEWVKDTFAGIVNVRYNASRLTLVTTRFPDSEPGQKDALQKDLTLEMQVGPAVRSRLYEMCKTISVEAPDFRRNNKNAEF